jgi:hypothetical protein
MTRYIPATAADPLSAALWKLSDPHGIGQTHDLFGWMDDTQGQRWLIVDTTFTIAVHPDAVLNGIADIMQPWIDGGHIPADTNAVLAALVESTRGGLLTVYDAFPALFKAMSKTTEDMITLNLLPPQMTA